MALSIIPGAPVGAHSLLLGASPAPDAVVTTSPLQVRLRFNNRI
jgi:methionine-rich copper-binding protein CopC